jgi:integrase
VQCDNVKLKVVIKGGDEDRGYFGDKTVKRLEDWLDVRPAKPGINTVFTALSGTRWNESKQEYESAKGYPLTVSGLLRILSNLGNSVGVPRVSTHSFRRTFVCLLTEAGANDGLIQKWGRWEDEKMVKLYRQAYQSGKLYNRYTPTDYLENDDSGEEA